MSQLLPLKVLEFVKKERVKRLEKELSELRTLPVDTLFECSFCHYQTKRINGSAKIFQEGKEKFFKCFSCGKWRKL